jgi:predicted PurR-regulated permease PerM
MPNQNHKVRTLQRKTSMKQLSALFSALIITAMIGLGVLIIGLSAFTNQNTVAVQNSATDRTANTNVVASSASTSSETEQLRLQVSDLQTQLDQATQTVQQYQNLILALQQRGVISITQDGRVFIPQSSTSGTH